MNVSLLRETATIWTSPSAVSSRTVEPAEQRRDVGANEVHVAGADLVDAVELPVGQKFADTRDAPRVGGNGLDVEPAVGFGPWRGRAGARSRGGRGTCCAPRARPRCWPSSEPMHETRALARMMPASSRTARSNPTPRTFLAGEGGVERVERRAVAIDGGDGETLTGEAPHEACAHEADSHDDDVHSASPFLTKGKEKTIQTS